MVNLEDIKEWMKTSQLSVIIFLTVIFISILVILYVGKRNWGNGNIGKIIIYSLIVFGLICLYIPIFYINKSNIYKNLISNHTDAIYILIIIIIGLIFFLTLSIIFSKFFTVNFPNYYYFMISCLSILSFLILLILCLLNVNLKNKPDPKPEPEPDPKPEPDSKEHKWIVPTIIISIILIIISPVVYYFRNQIVNFLKRINWNDIFIFLNKDNIINFFSNLIMVTGFILFIIYLI